MKAILTYHSIDSSGSVISIAADAFERQVRWIASSGVAVVPLMDLLRQPDDSDALAITFDDAYTNFEQEAWPRLRDRGLPVTLFVPTRFAGKTNNWGRLRGGEMPELPILGWPALSSLQENGVVLGAHTRTHADLRTLDAAGVDAEVLGSVEDIARETGRRPEAFAYPYGFWTPAAAAAVRSVCRCACTTELKALSSGDDVHLLPRLDAYYLRGPARLENFGGPAFRTYIGARALVRAIRQRLQQKRS